MGPALDENIEKMIAKTPGSHLGGCYMLNYGEQKPLTVEYTRNWIREVGSEQIS